MLTDNEIYENRLKVVKFLQQPERKKAFNLLDTGSGRRCCLGHMCHVLNIEKHIRADSFGLEDIRYGKTKEKKTAPTELINAVELWNMTGHPDNIQYKSYELTHLNDDKDMTPQEIGKYLEDNILGGRNTPWREINPIFEKEI